MSTVSPRSTRAARTASSNSFVSAFVRTAASAGSSPFRYANSRKLRSETAPRLFGFTPARSCDRRLATRMHSHLALVTRTFKRRQPPSMLIGPKTRNQDALPLSPCDKNVQAAPTTFNVDRTEIHADPAVMISTIPDADNHGVPFIALDVLKGFYEYRFRAAWFEAVRDVNDV